MCGRYNLTASSDAIVKHFQLLGPARFLPSYNIAPAQKILNIVELEDHSKKKPSICFGVWCLRGPKTAKTAHI